MTKEDIQLISWTIETSTFVVATTIVYLIWRISKRASDKKKQEQQDKEDRA
jgi:hypothetical protein